MALCTQGLILLSFGSCGTHLTQDSQGIWHSILFYHIKFPFASFKPHGFSYYWRVLSNSCSHSTSTKRGPICHKAGNRSQAIQSPGCSTLAGIRLLILPIAQAGRFFRAAIVQSVSFRLWQFRHIEIPDSPIPCIFLRLRPKDVVFLLFPTLKKATSSSGAFSSIKRRSIYKLSFPQLMDAI